MKSADFVHMINNGMALEGTITKEKANNTFYKATHFYQIQNTNLRHHVLQFFLHVWVPNLAYLGFKYFLCLKRQNIWPEYDHPFLRYKPNLTPST